MTNKNLVIEGLDVVSPEGMVFPGGSSSERPSVPKEKMGRISTETETFEIFLNGRWITIGDRAVKLESALTANYSASPNKMYPLDTSAIAFILTLPSNPNIGDIVTGYDESGTWGSNNLTVAAGSNPIESEVGNVIWDEDGGYFSYVWLGDSVGWVNAYGAKGRGGGLISWVEVDTTTPVTALPNTGYYVSTSEANAPTTINLPSSPTLYDKVKVVDWQGDAMEYPITIGRSGRKINRVNSDDVIKESWRSKEYTYFGNDATGDHWTITNDSSTNSVHVELSHTINLNDIPEGSYVQLSEFNYDPVTLNYPVLPNRRFKGEIIATRTLQFAYDVGGQKWVRDNGGSLVWGDWERIGERLIVNDTILNTNTNVEVNKIYGINTLSSIVTAVLPSTNLIVGDEIQFFDAAQGFHLNRLIIDADSNNIYSSRYYDVYTTGQALSLVWTGNRWIIKSNSNKGNSPGNVIIPAITGSTNAVRAGSFVNVDTSLGQVVAQLPSTPSASDTVWFIDTYGTFELNDFTVQAPGTRIRGLTQSLVFSKNHQAVCFVWSGDVSIGWVLNSNTHPELEIAGGIDWTTATVNSNGTTAEAGKGYRFDSSAGLNVITLPASPQEGDTIWFTDVAGVAGSNNVTLARNGSLVNGNATNVVIQNNRQTVGITFESGGIGWHTFFDSHGALKDYRPLDNIDDLAASAATHTPNFSGKLRIYETTATGNITINPPLLPSGSAGSFKIIVKMQGAGHAINVPGTGDSWYAGPSVTFNNADDAVNIIQADFDRSGNVYYNVVSYQT